ncbi:hypothetical protein BGZ63DRAFT_407427 [Mariannaea sp. PMI_226]|nr:hypothetical protein BGZ63DRAFT_407427 [Mariannaea sp. PMI_226]
MKYTVFLSTLLGVALAAPAPDFAPWTEPSPEAWYDGNYNPVFDQCGIYGGLPWACTEYGDIQALTGFNNGATCEGWCNEAGCLTEPVSCGLPISDTVTIFEQSIAAGTWARNSCSSYPDDRNEGGEHAKYYITGLVYEYKVVSKAPWKPQTGWDEDYISISTGGITSYSYWFPIPTTKL